ncbi:MULTISPECIES: nitronate monooxygenase [unclassified Mycobacterium]|uniref:NAD(P)H-dependent flavin oxidoreductase n=1 Tax=unclassified Mycobacterium TaxID=2642494 RepID=UPI00156054C3|nr:MULTISPECIES: nitronate monooxygenase [unclassified Mycobacterium]
MTDLLGIEHPILSAAMGFVADPGLVAAVSDAGGFGLLATAPLTPAEVERSVLAIRRRTDRPFGANVTLQFATAPANLAVLLKHQISAVNVSMGFSAEVAQQIRDAGAVVLATVTSVKHVLSAERKGADGLIVTGHEGGGHAGDVSSLVLLPAVAASVSIPVVGAGGFGDGAGLAAALVLGAEGVSMGSRFAVTRESPLHPRTKEAVRSMGHSDTLYSDQIDGWGARVIRAEGARRFTARGVLAGVRAALAVHRERGLKPRDMAKMAAASLAGGPSFSLLLKRAQVLGASQRGLLGGDLESGIVSIGQVGGTLTDSPSAREVIVRTVEQAETILRDRYENVVVN